MRRLMMVALPILLGLWVAAGISNLVTDPDTTASTVVGVFVFPVAWFLMVPVAGFLGGVIGFQPRRMNNLYGGGWQKGMRLMRREGRWHHT